jgi:hypothetical protein
VPIRELDDTDTIQPKLTVPSLVSENATISDPPKYQAPSIFTPQVFNGAVMMPFMANAFKFQSSNIMTSHTTSTSPNNINIPTNPPNEASSTRKRKGPKNHEERRLKNREAADKSRQKRRDLLEKLPAENAALEARVQALECGLAASQAEANSLREQCNFLKSLLSNGHNFLQDGGITQSLQNTYETTKSSIPHTSQGVLLLAVCCILTVNQFGLLMESLPNNESLMHNGGRILLSVETEDTEESYFRFLTYPTLNSMGSNCLFAMIGIAMLYFRNFICTYVSNLRWSPCLPDWNRCCGSFFKTHEHNA